VRWRSPRNFGLQPTNFKFRQIVGFWPFWLAEYGLAAFKIRQRVGFWLDCVSGIINATNDLRDSRNGSASHFSRPCRILKLHMPDSRLGRNPFFPLTALFSAAFVVTILALVATVFGDEQAPLAKWLDQHVGWLLAGEVVAILLTGFLALAVDRRQTLRDQQAARTPDSKLQPHPGPDSRQENP
jgi:uncharacterized membrane protein YcjF (UPF0283 family)